MKKINEWMRISQAARYLGMSEPTLRKYVKEGAFEVLEKDMKKLRPYKMIRSKIDN